jgi:hypothetical protein
LVVPSFIFNLGFVRGWELVAQFRNFVLLGDVPGQSRWRLVDTGVFLKGVLREGSLQGATGPSVATEFGAILPTWHGEPGAGALASGILSQRWDAVTLHLNLAASLSRAERFDLFGGLIVEGPYTWTVRPVLEVFAEREFGASTTVSGLVGVIWRASESLSVDVALRGERIGDLNGAEIRAGFTWAFAVWKP